MRKNLAGQTIGAQLINLADGTPFTGVARVAITGDAGVQDVTPIGAVVHEGRGYHSYLPDITETNFDHIAFTFDDAALLAVAQTVQVYTNIPLLGYEDASIWIDTVNGVAGSVLYVNGTADDPVDNLTDALTLSTALGFNRFKVLNGSTLVLDTAITGKFFEGLNWDLNLNGQIVTETLFVGSTVSGTCTGSTIGFSDGNIGAVTIPPAKITECGLLGPLIANAAGDFFIINCFSVTAGASAFVFNFGALIGDTALHYLNSNGTIQLDAMGDTGTDTAEISGSGIFTEGTCAGGSVNIQGDYVLNGITNLTLVDDSRYGRSSQVDAIWDEVLDSVDHIVPSSAGKRLRELTEIAIRRGLAQGPGAGNNQIQLDTGASSVDGLYDPSTIELILGTGAGQTRGLLEYDGATKIGTVDRNWKINPDATTEFVILAGIGRQHVNEGLAQGGTSTTITLNILASSFDDAYNGQIVFIRSGTGDDQSRIIVDYDGATQIATVHKPWDVIPNTTSAYVMLPVAEDPNAQVEISQNSADKVWQSAGRTLTSFSTGLAISVWDVLRSNVITAGTMGLLARNEDTITEDLRIVGTAAAAGVHTLTQMDTDIVVNAGDQFKGRVIVFARDTTTVELRGQIADITGGETATNRLIFTALTTTPVDGEVFTML